jgi:hypothetical protein
MVQSLPQRIVVPPVDIAPSTASVQDRTFLDTSAHKVHSTDHRIHIPMICRQITIEGLETATEAALQTTIVMTGIGTRIGTANPIEAVTITAMTTIIAAMMTTTIANAVVETGVGIVRAIDHGIDHVRRTVAAPVDGGSMTSATEFRLEGT